MLNAEIDIMNIGLSRLGLMKTLIYAAQKEMNIEYKTNKIIPDFIGKEGKSVSSQFSNVSFSI